MSTSTLINASENDIRACCCSTSVAVVARVGRLRRSLRPTTLDGEGFGRVVGGATDSSMDKGGWRWRIAQLRYLNLLGQK